MEGERAPSKGVFATCDSGPRLCWRGDRRILLTN